MGLMNLTYKKGVKSKLNFNKGSLASKFKSNEENFFSEEAREKRLVKKLDRDYRKMEIKEKKMEEQKQRLKRLGFD